jgi:fluoroquinolone transport system ATP-binding protein
MRSVSGVCRRNGSDVIKAEGLTYTYPGAAEPTVRELSFTVEPGEIFGFLGPSGAGKSTVQKILTGQLAPFEGSAEVFGRPLVKPGREYYEDIGVGFELPNLFTKLTAQENLRFFASFYRRSADPASLLAQVGLTDHAERRVADYSKGLKMRLCFVRALLHDPPVLCLDEPTSGLDPVNARLIKDMVQEQQRRGKTVFLTTHNMHDADELCDRVAFFVDGQIERIGSPAQLRADHGRRRVVLEYRRSDPASPEVEVAEFDLDGLAENLDFHTVLRDHDVLSMHSTEQSLEDVFIEATGRKLT